MDKQAKQNTALGIAHKIVVNLFQQNQVGGDLGMLDIHKGVTESVQGVQRMEHIYSELRETRVQLQKTIDSVLVRGEKLDDLGLKSKYVRGEAAKFEKHTNGVIPVDIWEYLCCRPS
jgi:hypothetical protein